MASTPEPRPVPDVSIVVPVYRSAPILPRLCAETKAAMAAAGLGDRFELILVCDASPDESWSVIEQQAREHAFVRGVHLRCNAGQHNATMAGLARVRGSRVVVMDDDLQHNPSYIPALLAELEKGFDVCYTRFHNRQHELWKIAGSKFNDAVATIVLRKPRGLYLSSFKAMVRGVADEVVRYDGPYAYVDGLILDVTRRITAIDIEHAKRAQGQGNYDFVRSVSLWFKMATSFSIFPLRLLALGGSLLALVALGLMAYVIVLKILHPDIAAGWTSLMAAILLVGGMQLLGMGLIGEYLGRAYLKLNRKPQYVVRETVGPDAAVGARDDRAA